MVKNSIRFLGACLALAPFGLPAKAADYRVGPGEPLQTIGEVPWASLQPGDNVAIHWRPEPYREKWVICRRGTESKPITVRGIKGPHGELPVIDGAGAETVKGVDYPGETRSVIKIGAATVPRDCMPANLVLANLEVTNAAPPHAFEGRKGPANYVAHAAGIWIEKGENIVVRGCRLHGNANGLFVSHASANVVVEGCVIEGNGLVKSLFQHNVYSEANGIVFRFNRFGPLRPGSPGNNLKDRSAGLVVHDNWIEGGGRELDLVEAEGSEALRRESSYGRTWVYRNVIVEPAGAGNNQIVHYGGDSGKAQRYRKGTLFFYNNTVVSKRRDRTTLFRLMTNEEHVEARNNIFYTAASGKNLAIVDSAGQVDLAANWLKPGWVNAFGHFTGSVRVNGRNENGNSPGFVNEAAGDYRLAPGSPCRGAGVPVALPGEAAPETPPDLGAPGVPPGARP